MGLIMAGLGGMAKVGINQMQDQRRADLQSERDLAQEESGKRMAQYNSDLALKREEALANIRAQAARVKEMRQANQYDQIDTDAEQNGLQRDASSMTRGAAGLPSEGEFAGQPVKPEDIANLPPAARLAYERSGLINRSSESRLIRDKVDAARSIGADPEVRKELRDQYGVELKYERDEASKNATLEETKRHNQATETNGAITAGAAQTRAGAAVTAAGSQQAKPLSGAVLKQLTEARDTANTISNLSASFKDGFAGKGLLGMGADMQLGASSVAGVDKDAVAWWKDYRKQAELVERHALFGAALTPTEQASWRSADIGPGMDKDVIKTNLATRAALAKRMLENTRQDFIDAGHSEERVSAIAGRSSQHAASVGGASGSWGPENTAKAKSVSVGGATMEARQAADGKYYVKQANGKYAEVRN